MPSRKTQLAEGRSPFSGTQALNAGRHTHGRRHATRFAATYQLDKVKDHVVDLTMQLARAVRLRRPEKAAILADLIARTKANGQVLGERLAASMNSPVVHIGKSRVLLDLRPTNYVTAPMQQRFARTIVNHKRAFVLALEE